MLLRYHDHAVPVWYKGFSRRSPASKAEGIIRHLDIGRRCNRRFFVTTFPLLSTLDLTCPNIGLTLLLPHCCTGHTYFESNPQ